MLTINIETHSAIPMYEQIYSYIKNEIKLGNLPHQTKLPSTRNLAVNLQVSRNTIDMAYAQLLSEGYIESIPGSGYYVCLISDLTHITAKHSTSTKISKPNTISYRYNFSPFAIDISNFPYNIWRKLSKECMNENNNDLFLLGNNQGDESLRNAIARYLHESRGVNCNTEQIIVGAGADYLLQILSQLLQYINTNKKGVNVENNDQNRMKTKEKLRNDSINTSIVRESQTNMHNCLAMENPTYKQVYKIFTGMNYDVIPINLDQNGINIENLTNSPANIVYVTPSHQYPLGIVMPIKRRLELLNWANNLPNRYIIEDDHDSEFRYKGKPIPSLQGIDSLGKVIYLGTFSRAIAPAIRIGYMVLPDELLKLYKAHLSYYSSPVSRVDQNIMTHFITDGYFERHLNKMRKIYKNKHDLLIQYLKVFKDKIRIEGENAGLHLVIHFNIDVTEEEIIDAAAKRNIKLYGLQEHYLEAQEPKQNIKNHTSPTILLGYANVSESDLQGGVIALYEALETFF
jgi:GntR family transcriptional regulator / MocR family aminotransferase